MTPQELREWGLSFHAMGLGDLKQLLWAVRQEIRTKERMAGEIRSREGGGGG